MTAKKCADAPRGACPHLPPCYATAAAVCVGVQQRLEFLVQLWCITSIWPPNSILTRWRL